MRYRDLLAKLGADPVLQPDLITPQAVTTALPPGTLFVDYGVYQPFAPSDKTIGERHLVMAVYRPREEVLLLDAGVLDQGTLDQIRDITCRRPDGTDSTLYPARKALSDKIVGPLRQIFADSTLKRLILSPDGALQRINPLMLFADPHGGELVMDRFDSVQVIPSGRQLLPGHISPDAAATGPDLMAAGAADYGQKPDLPKTAPDCSTAGIRGGQTGFDPLPQAREELDQITRVAEAAGQEAVAPLTGGAALEQEVVKEMRGARIIHLATHGATDFLGEASLQNVGLAFAGANQTLFGSPDTQTALRVGPMTASSTAQRSASCALTGLILSFCRPATPRLAPMPGLRDITAWPMPSDWREQRTC